MTNETMSNENIAKVAIIGRTNVGKSTLFNRLTSSRKAIISPLPGTTRDPNYGECFWCGENFTLVDTGGLEDSDYKKYSTNTGKKRLEEIEINVKKQALIALKKAAAIIFVLDSKDGILPQDKAVAKLLRQNNKPVIIAINKSSRKSAATGLSEYHSLGLGYPYPVSATSGIGIGDLLDEIVKKLPKKSKNLLTEDLSREDNKTIKQHDNLSTDLPTKEVGEVNITISVIGRPNVGKSSFINCLLGEERLIVSAEPHTTREAQEITIHYEPKQSELADSYNNKKEFAYSQNLHQDSRHSYYIIKLIDTAGIRRKAKIDDPLEKIGVRQSIGMLERSDIIFFMIDASEPLSKQDQSLARLIKNVDRPTLILANKWDLVHGIEMSVFEKYFKKYFPHLSFAPIIFMSCKNKKNLGNVLPAALEIYNESSLTIAREELN